MPQCPKYAVHHMTMKPCSAHSARAECKEATPLTQRQRPTAALPRPPLLPPVSVSCCLSSSCRAVLPAARWYSPVWGPGWPGMLPTGSGAAPAALAVGGRRAGGQLAEMPRMCATQSYAPIFAALHRMTACAVSSRVSAQDGIGHGADAGLQPRPGKQLQLQRGVARSAVPAGKK